MAYTIACHACAKLKTACDRKVKIHHVAVERQAYFVGSCSSDALIMIVEIIGLT